MHFHPTFSLVVGMLALALVGCNSGGDVPLGTNTTQSASVTPPIGSQLESRAMPGTNVVVTTETAIVAGQPVSVQIAAPDLPPGSTLAVSIGADHGAALAATITPLSSNTWRAAMTLSNPLPAGSCVLVRLTLADGSILESGLDDFVLRPRALSAP